MTQTRVESSPGRAAAGEVVAALVDVSKRFGQTLAVQRMNLTLVAGDVLALVGENGAGKSTCVKMLAGLYEPIAGHISIEGEQVSLRSPQDAQALGIAVVHQHPGLFPDLPIYENVFAGRPIKTRWGQIDRGQMRVKSQALLSTLGLKVDTGRRSGDLSTSEQQLVEIAKALASEARVLILDEPTASLTVGETQRLFTTIKHLRSQGVAMMFVGHRLEEILEISDRITVMRDGQWVTDLRSKDTNEHDLVKLMVGRELDALYPTREPPTDTVVLRVDNLSVDGQFSGISVEVHAGEVVGLAGLVGAGRTEVARAIFGIDKPTGGGITIDGRRIKIHSPAEAMANGVAYLSEDRRGQSIIEEFSILDNAALPVVDKATRLGLLRRRLEFALVSESLERMRLKYAGLGQPIGELSGGNQQKVVLAKWLATNPKLLILDEPTQGVDVQAKAEVHRIIADLAAQGLAVLLISSDMPELMGMCDRSYVMYQGEMMAEFAAADFNQVDIGLAATGLLRSDTSPDTAGTTHVTVAARQALTQAGEHQTSVVVQTPRPNAVRQLVSQRQFGLFAAIIVVLIPLVITNPSIASGGNVGDVVQTLALYGVVCLGEMFVMLTRNIDLSVGSTIGLTGYISADFMAGHHGAPVIAGIGLAVFIGLVCGLVNGLIVAVGRVPSIVVTLGTMAIYRGIDAILSTGKQISTSMVTNAWIDWTNGTVLGIPKVTWYGIIIALIVAYFLRSTTLGRDFYTTGSNPKGAELIGVRTKRAVIAAFSLSGILAGFAGSMWASYYATVDGQLAYGAELIMIASVVVGGVSLRGGVGTVSGVVLGALALIVIQNAITIARINPSYLQAFFGAAILLTVAIDSILATRNRSGLRRSS